MNPPKVHFSGIGGTAMVAGARLAMEAGWEVRGSDGPLYPPASHMTEALGVLVNTSYAAANLDWQPDQVILGNALSRGNPEVEAALSRHLHYLSLPEWLKENVLRRRLPVVVSGTHGKTTTTALLAHVLTESISGVGFLIGGEALGFDHSSRLGAEGAPFVIEGDEYDTAFFDKRAKFLHYLPQIAIVTSLEFDHGDIYRDLQEIETAFERMLRQIPQEGSLFVCADNAAARLCLKAYCPTESYGLNADADWRGEVVGVEKDRQCIKIWHGNSYWGTVHSPLWGRHNALNTLAAVASAAVLDVSASDIAKAVASFSGVRRRMEIFLDRQGSLFIDDFAHHPTAIRETIAAARSRWPSRRIRAIFEPRSNTTVRRRFQQELEKVFADADEVLLGPVHRKETIPEDDRLDTKALAKAIQRTGISASSYDDIDNIVAYIDGTLQKDDIILIMSNGAFGGIYDRFRALPTD